jgi:hypothetical protein
MRRWSGSAGLVFVVLAVLSPFVRGNRPDVEGAHALTKLVKFYAVSGHRDQALAAALLGFLGLFFFLWFLAGLWATMRDSAPIPALLSAVILAGGTAFIVFGALSHVFANVIGVTLRNADAYKFDANTAILFDEMHFATRALAMIAVGAMLTAAGLIIHQTRVLPVWLAWVGFAIAILALPAIPVLTFIAELLLAVWILAVSALTIRTSPATISPTPTER